jgi:hypothetical protein
MMSIPAGLRAASRFGTYNSKERWKKSKCRELRAQGLQLIAGKERRMLWTIFVILLVLWLLGLVSGYTMGGVIHVLLVIAIIVLIVRLVQGRRVL